MSPYLEGKVWGGNLYFCEPETVLPRKSIYPKNEKESASDLIFFLKVIFNFEESEKRKINLMKFFSKWDLFRKLFDINWWDLRNNVVITEK